MAKTLLEVQDHVCFCSHRANLHTHPNLNHCLKPNCPGAISDEMAHKAGYVDAEGNVTCPHVKKDGTICGYATSPSGDRKVIEVHAALCTDATIHYPQMRKRGEITEETYQAWKATLTQDELLGRYKRVEDIPITATFHDDEAALLETDATAFNVLLQQRLKDRAEVALRYQTPYRHTTATVNVTP